MKCQYVFSSSFTAAERAPPCLYSTISHQTLSQVWTLLQTHDTLVLSFRWGDMMSSASSISLTQHATVSDSVVIDAVVVREVDALVK